MKSTYKTVQKLAILAIFVTMAGGKSFAGAGSGGGGGGIEFNGKFYTLTQAGLKVEANPNEPYFLDLETVNETSRILGRLDAILPGNLKGQLRSALGNTNHTYQKLTVTNPALYVKVKGEYQQYIDSLPIKGKFILPAHTSKSGVTSLFPDFFDPKTSMTQRAIWLISHETIWFVRPSAKLIQVLRFEGALEAFIESPGDSKTWMPIYDALADLHLMSGSQWGTDSDVPQASVLDLSNDMAMYVMVLQHQGKKLTLADLASPTTRAITEGDTPVGGVGLYYTDLNCYPGLFVDPLTLRQNETIDVEYFGRFFGARIENDEACIGKTMATIIGGRIQLSNTSLTNMEVYYSEFNGEPGIKIRTVLDDGTFLDLNGDIPFRFISKGYGNIVYSH